MNTKICHISHLRVVDTQIPAVAAVSSSLPEIDRLRTANLLSSLHLRPRKACRFASEVTISRYSIDNDCPFTE